MGDAQRWGEICGLGPVVGDKVGIGQWWQRWGRQCSCSHHLSDIRRVHRRVFEVQRGGVVAVTVGCQCPDLHPTLLLIPFPPCASYLPPPCPIVITNPLEYPSTIPGPFPSFLSLSSLFYLSSSLSWLLNTCSLFALADGTRC